MRGNLVRNYKTDIEQIMFNKLSEMEVEFVFQYPIRCKYGYIADFYLPEFKLLIECDGERWHNKKRDNAKNSVVRKLGYNIIRFKGKEIKQNIDLCFQKILIKMKGGDKNGDKN
jgi:very-short-patch-repair endonuclease